MKTKNRQILSQKGKGKGSPVSMGFRYTCTKCLLIGLGATFVLGCIIASLPIQLEPDDLSNELKENNKQQSTRKPKLAIIVPFRERFEELLQFVPHMDTFLQRQHIPYRIFVIQQKDNYRFNRASLINVGFLYTAHKYDYIAMHDVDLLPLNDQLKYSYPSNGPFHVSAPNLHPKYHYDTFIGGILLLTREDFELAGGMSNRYWGWGLEDDEFYVRLKEAGLQVQRPVNLTTGIADTFKHIHDKSYRKRDMRKCYNQREVTRRRDRQTGLHDVAYRIDSRHELTVDGLPLTVVNVELQCNRTATPWCLCPEPEKPKTVKKD